LTLVGGYHKNPEGRIADDVRIARESPIDFTTGVTTAVLSAATFIAVLWTIGGAFTFHIHDTAITIPGFLVVAAVIYAVAASGTMFIIGRSLISVSENKNQAEAEYRYLLTRVRENGEGIALLKGEDEERSGGGDIEIAAGGKLLVLPQRPYVPTGTLRRAVTYPDAAQSRSKAESAKVLEKVELGHLAAHLDEEGPWDQILSGGEKQRLAFARLFLHRPDIIVL